MRSVDRVTLWTTLLSGTAWMCLLVTSQHHHALPLSLSGDEGVLLATSLSNAVGSEVFYARNCTLAPDDNCHDASAAHRPNSPSRFQELLLAQGEGSGRLPRGLHSSLDNHGPIFGRVSGDSCCYGSDYSTRYWLNRPVSRRDMATVAIARRRNAKMPSECCFNAARLGS